jgi:hypothetical protein
MIDFVFLMEQFLAYLNDIFDPLLNALSDPSDAVSSFRKVFKTVFLVLIVQ